MACIGGFCHSVLAGVQNIHTGKPFPVLLVGAFTLIGGNRAAPHKIFWKAHFYPLVEITLFAPL
jgi:hypothetical protein